MFSKLAISNLAFPESELPTWVDGLRSQGFSGLEIAPTKIWGDWNSINISEVQNFSKYLKSLGVAVPALQSLLFGRPHLKLFSAQEVFEHLRKHFTDHVLPIAEILEAPVLIFGSPKNRVAPVHLTSDDYDLACERFATLANECVKTGTILLIESNPAEYGTNFILDSAEAANLVRDVSHPNFGLHLDLACMEMAGEKPLSVIQKYGAAAKHFHITRPSLAPLDEYIPNLQEIIATLVKINPNIWVAIEMLEGTTEQIEKSMKQVHDVCAFT